MPLSYATQQNASCRVGFAASLDFESILATRQRVEPSLINSNSKVQAVWLCVLECVVYLH